MSANTPQSDTLSEALLPAIFNACIMHFLRQMHLLNDSLDKEKGPDFCNSAAGLATKWKKQLDDLEWFRDGLVKLTDDVSRKMPILIEGLSTCITEFHDEVYARFERASEPDGVGADVAAEALLNSAIPEIGRIIRRAEGLQEQLRDSFRKKRKLKRSIGMVRESLEGANDLVKKVKDAPEDLKMLLQNALTEIGKIENEYR